MHLHAILLNPAGLNVRLFHLFNGWHIPIWNRPMIVGTWLADKRVVGAMAAMSAIIGLVRWRYHGKADAGAMLGVGLGLSYVVTSALIFVIKHFLSWGRPAYVLPRYPHKS